MKKRNIIKPIGDGIAEVHLTKGLCAMIDQDCIENIACFNWTAVACNSGIVYARGTVSVNPVGMHRLLMCFPLLQVDHINRNTLDNRRCNLRLCTPSQNNYNKRGWGKTSSFKGVCRQHEHHRWRAVIQIRGKNIALGSYDSEEDAARAHDEAAKLHHGEFAYLNFPENQIAKHLETTHR